jgi:hypothetical protein
MNGEAEKFYNRPNVKNFVKRLSDLYVGLYINTGMSKAQAEEIVRGLLQMAVQETIDADTYNLPSNLGDVVLGNAMAESEKIESFAEGIRQKIPYLKSEGVTEEDIRYYWNLNELERRMATLEDNSMRIGVFAEARKNGKTVEQASAEVRKVFPMYGNPDDKNQPKGEDRPFPYELKDLINKYIKRRSLDISSYKNDIEKSSSLNALIRKEIKAGNLY